MNWYVLMYNRVHDRIVLVEELGKDDGVPDHFFAEMKVNGELDGYFVYMRTDDKEVWGKWKKRTGGWDTPQEVPDVVKLWRLMTT